MTTVVELFDNDQEVHRAVEELRRQNFAEDEVLVVDQARLAGAEESADPTSPDLNQALATLGVAGNEVRFYAKGIKVGGRLVIVRTNGERTGEVRAILRRARDRSRHNKAG